MTTYIDIELMSCADFCVREKTDGMFIVELGDVVEEVDPSDMASIAIALAELVRLKGWK